MADRTPLFDNHIALDARMTVYRGWEMPLHYGSQVDEHNQVRSAAGAFDVSHLGRLDVTGRDAEKFLRYLLAGDVARLEPGRILYACMLDDSGGILDDVLVYDLGKTGYRLVTNAINRQKDRDWIKYHARPYKVTLTARDDLAMIAVQGPQALARLSEVLDPEIAGAAADLAAFHHLEAEDMLISRTGYTGEEGVEITLPDARAASVWDRLMEAGVQPCGLGARDTLRLEAGFNLYGNEVNENTSPLVCGLEHTVDWEPKERSFIGRSALKKQRREGVRQCRMGLVLEERGMLRAHQRVIAPSGATGLITSGTFSPTLGCSIALARVPADIGPRCQVDIRHKYSTARVVQPPFVRHGRSLIQIPVD